MKQILNMGRISVGRRLILLPILTIPMSILSRLQMIWTIIIEIMNRVPPDQLMVLCVPKMNLVNLFVFVYYFSCIAFQHGF
jgi:hypothetical protein